MTTEQMIEEALEQMIKADMPHLYTVKMPESLRKSAKKEFVKRIKPVLTDFAKTIATKSAEEAVEEIDALIEESGGVYGLHMNGEPATWEWLINNGWLEKTGKLLSQPKDTNE